MQKSWDWLVRRISEKARTSAGELLLAGFAALALLATVWLVWPLQNGSELTACFMPTASPTRTRVVVQREPTPTDFSPTATPPPLTHVVEEGEVLGVIAERYDTTMKALLEANDLEDADLVSVGQELIMVDAKGTPVPVVALTPSSTPTPTSVFRYGAPVLLGPRDSAVFRTQEARIVLQWAAVASLHEGEWYQVRVWSQGHEDVYRAWTKTPSWKLPQSLHRAGGDNEFYWNVTVVHRGRGQTTPLSPTAHMRRFTWY